MLNADYSQQPASSVSLWGNVPEVKGSHVRASSDLVGDFTCKATKITLLLAGTSVKMRAHAGMAVVYSSSRSCGTAVIKTAGSQSAFHINLRHMKPMKKVQKQPFLTRMSPTESGLLLRHPPNGRLSLGKSNQSSALPFSEVAASWRAHIWISGLFCHELLSEL